jgi:hypothetical protein
MSALGDVLGKVASQAAEAPQGKPRLWVLRTLDFCRDASVQELPAHVRPTLIALAKCADVHGVCWPSYRVLADYTGRSRRTVMRHVKQLSAFVDKERRYRVDARSPEQPRNRSNKYRMRVPERSRRSRRAAAAVEPKIVSNPPPSAVARPSAEQVACAASVPLGNAERPTASPGRVCAGQAPEAHESATCPNAEAVLRVLRGAPLLSAVANGEDAARLWGIARGAGRTVADVEAAIAELVQKSPTGVRWSRERAWGRVVAFVEHARRSGASSAARREQAAAERRREAEERQRDDEARRGAVPIPAALVAQLRERGLLPARPP